MTALAQRFAWRGREVAWERIGSGAPVVLCHGTPFSSVIWRPFAATLAADHAVYLWDMPGYGVSSKDSAHPVDLGVQGELFRDLLAEWGLARPDVIAHDIGGAVALRAHALHGAGYRSLMLVDVVALPPFGSPFFAFVREHGDAMHDLPPYIHEAIVRAYIGNASHRGLRDDDLATLVAPWTTAEGHPAFYRQIQQADERYVAELEARLANIAIPVRIVWGRDDTWIPHDTAARLHDRIPGSTCMLVDGAGHLMHYDAPAVLAGEMQRWLGSRDAARST